MVKIKQIGESEVFEYIGKDLRVFAADINDCEIYELEYERICEIKAYIAKKDLIYFYIDEPEGGDK